MTRRSKKYCTIQSNNYDEKLQEALQDPNAQVYYDDDGNYTIEYKPSSSKQAHYADYIDYFDIIYNIHKELQDYCKELPLTLLNRSRTSDLYDLIRQYISTVREADDSPIAIVPLSIISIKGLEESCPFMNEQEPQSTGDGWVIVQTKR